MYNCMDEDRLLTNTPTLEWAAWQFVVISWPFTINEHDSTLDDPLNILFPLIRLWAEISSVYNFVKEEEETRIQQEAESLIISEINKRWKSGNFFDDINEQWKDPDSFEFALARWQEYVDELRGEQNAEERIEEMNDAKNHLNLALKLNNLPPMFSD